MFLGPGPHPHREADTPSQNPNPSAPSFECLQHSTAPSPPTILTSFTPSCDVFLYSVARPIMFILAYAYIFGFSWGPTDKGVHKGPTNLATPLQRPASPTPPLSGVDVRGSLSTRDMPSTDGLSSFVCIRLMSQPNHEPNHASLPHRIATNLQIV